MNYPPRAVIRLVLFFLLLVVASCNGGQSLSAVPSATDGARAAAATTAVATARIATATASAVPTPSPTVEPIATLPPPTVVSPVLPDGLPLYGYRVIHTYPHDTNAFTEGLTYYDGFLYEGTGLNGMSELRKVELATGKVLQSRPLDPQYFGEGIATYGEKIVQLTWQSHIGFVFDRATFEPENQFSYASEGWGLTYDGTRLIMSDGTPTIHFLDPTSFQPLGQITVTAGGQGVGNLNELEWVKGEILANVWLTNRIARISPATGQVTGWIDLTGLRPPETFSNRDAVPNGIAYDAARDRLFVTGKLWPSLFEIQLVPKTSLMLPLVANSM